MKTYNNAFTFLGLGLCAALILQGQAHAQDYCKKTSPKLNIPYQFRSVNKDTPLYSPVTEWFTFGFQQIYNGCTNLPANWKIGLTAPFNRSQALPDYEGHTIFPYSSTPIGLIMDYQSEKEPGVWKPFKSDTLKDAAIILASSQDTPVPPSSYHAALRFRLIKVKELNRKTNVQPIGNGGFFIGQTTTDTQVPISFNIDISAPNQTCTVNIPPSIDLGDHSASELPQPGATTQDVPFEITLSNCARDGSEPLPAHYPKIAFQISGKSDPYTNALGVLQLDNIGSPETAKGVGIQIGYQPFSASKRFIEFDKAMPFKDLIWQETSATIPFFAHYIRDSQVIQPGKANGTATLYMVYS